MRGAPGRARGPATTSIGQTGRTDAAGLPVSRPAARSPHRGVVPLNVVDARILEGVAAGSSSMQLAARLFLSRQGVEYHIGRMLRRFRVPNRTALVCRAYSLGIFDSRSWPPRVLIEFVAER